MEWGNGFFNPREGEEGIANPSGGRYFEGGVGFVYIVGEERHVGLWYWMGL